MNAVLPGQPQKRHCLREGSGHLQNKQPVITIKLLEVCLSSSDFDIFCVLLTTEWLVKSCVLRPWLRSCGEHDCVSGAAPLDV